MNKKKVLTRQEANRLKTLLAKQTKAAKEGNMLKSSKPENDTYASIVVESNDEGIIQVKTPMGEILHGVTNFNLSIDANEPSIYYANFSIINPKVNISGNKVLGK